MFASHLLGRVINGLRPVATPQQQIELEPGQVFRGTIIKAYPNQMVQVQLAGTTLYAQLNAPLEVGQQAWLQVLPKSNPITLKVVDTPRSDTGFPTATTADLTEKSAIEGLLRGLGIKADRINIQSLQLMVDSGLPLKTAELGRVLDLLKKSTTPDRTIQLLQLAHQRGLSMTNEVIRSLEAAFFGRSLGEIANQLSQHAHENKQAQPLLQRVALIWQAANAHLAQVVRPQSMTTTNHSSGTSTMAQQQTLPQTQHVQAESQVISSQTQPSQMGKIEQTTTNTNVPIEITSEHKAPATQDNGLFKFFKLLGIDYEQTLLSRNVFASSDAHATIQPEHLQQLKGVLLELRAMDHLSPALREAIDQGIRSITGQQLLMVNDGNTPWNSFVFQIPLPHMQKAEPSFIHVEGRKKGKEAIDHENCRLFFHLDLDTLEQTMIDIQITNRIMSIQIYNDYPFVKEWIEEYREEWSEAMLGQEYHLSSIRVLPIPIAEQQASSILPVQSTSYRGVDLRI